MFLKFQTYMPKVFKLCNLWQYGKRKCHTISNRYFEVTEEVQECLKSESPVVALESTIITHGMPYPKNLETAVNVETIVRKYNATPATIGVIEGKIHIGMDKMLLERLASKYKEAVKISRRDLPFALSMKLTGGTTVAATMILAHKAGIDVFVSGGIGGVHRNGENTMDISADLIELSKTPMTVVSAGAKSILDIGRTLEFLETYGVSVATFGNSKEFPAFFTPNSGHFVPYNVPTASNAAQMIISRNDLNLKSGILIAVPIPSEYAADGIKTEDAIKQALEEARLKNVIGKDVTPFILDRVKELSGGASLKANIALIENNAMVGSQIAVELAKIKGQRRNGNKSLDISNRDAADKKNNLKTSFRDRDFFQVKRDFSSQVEKENKLLPRPVVIGGSCLDITIISHQQDIQRDGGTYPGEVELSAGGVGRNLADCLARLNVDPFFISAVGSDDNGAILLDKMKHLDTSGIAVIKSHRSGIFGILLNQSRECLSCVGDMDIHELINAQQVDAYKDILLNAPLVAIDGNISCEAMQQVFSLCAENRIPVWFEPTDLYKAAKPFTCDRWREAIAFISPNIYELKMIHGAIFGTNTASTEKITADSTIEDIIKECMILGLDVIKRIPNVIVTLGKHGCLVLSFRRSQEPFLDIQKPIRHDSSMQDEVHAVYYPSVKASQIISVSGAGDCFASAIMAGIINGESQYRCIRAGQAAAALSLSSHDAVPKFITKESIFESSNINLKKIKNIPVSQ